ncbi:hypothetical protein EI74_0583 [Mycoplasma testudineum]|uniref:Cof subfamily protein (Haloacid dehalogenase superfamily)/HAD superfamily hydrolase (TIGR01484 family) n=1 Tax=Mycoplasma testudineum TaxID=244584 RepID=A0A4R6IC21_9MOLU|nr:HAD family hydrolase [Mycoplasma testudineum]OYD26651.1 hypothetical protein CG473_02515 [Mycoplasma testudineum]TDO19780.1 hypothetical protein EI74_0583 [Mycoplasma testudineum]
MNIKNFKTFIFDLDGTLYDSTHKLHPENIKLIQKLNEAGKQVILATGRSINLIKKTLTDVDSDFATISINGGLVKEFKTGKIIHQEKISDSDSLAVLKLLKKYNIETAIYTENGLVFNVELSKTDSWVIKQNWENADLIENAIITIIDQPELIKGHSVMKFDISTQKVSAYNFKKFQNELESSFLDLIGYFSSPYVFELMPKTVSKGNAIKSMANSGIINLTTTIAFGDEANDISSAQIVPNFVAMANSNPLLLSYAKYKTEYTNNEAGVAKFIKTVMGFDYD